MLCKWFYFHRFTAVLIIKCKLLLNGIFANGNFTYTHVYSFFAEPKYRKSDHRMQSPVSSSRGSIQRYRFFTHSYIYIAIISNCIQYNYFPYEV